jgi:hypothetical protein
MMASMGPWVEMKNTGWVRCPGWDSQSALTGQSGLANDHLMLGNEKVITDVISRGFAVAVRTAPVAPWECPTAATSLTSRWWANTLPVLEFALTR